MQQASVNIFPIAIALPHPLQAKELLVAWGALPNELRKVPPAIVFIVPIPVKLKYKKQWIDGDNLTGDGLSHWPQFVIELANERL